MADWSKPTLTSTYTNFLTELSTRIDDAGKLSRSDTVTLTNPPVGTIRWNVASAKWQTNTGTVAVPVWSDLAATYGISISGNAATATSATSATSATTATTATNQSGGTVSATTLSASSTVTLSGGTANGVPYLNGSKVLTSGTALVFDGANLGVGVAPSAWGAGQKSIHLGQMAAIRGDAATLGLNNNAYFNGTAWTYQVTGSAANKYEQSSGVHAWHIAPSGTAGAAITFTQAMTLDASGNLGVGTSSPYSIGASITTVDVSGAAGGGIIFQRTAATATSGYIVALSGEFRVATLATNPLTFFTNNTERARIDASGNLIAAATVTGHWQIPRGTTAQRPTGASGMIRFNSSVNKYEGHNGTAWANIGGGATGGGTDDVFVENGQSVNTDYTITTGKNAMSAGPITIASGITVTVPSGSTWVVV